MSVFILIIVVVIINYYCFHVRKPDNKNQDTNTKKQPPPKKYQEVTTPTSKHARNDYFQKLGVEYEKKVGKKFEELGYYVVYNGLIKGLLDEGVDLIAIDFKRQDIHLIQCKNWKKMVMTHELLEKVYRKLSCFNFHPANYAADNLASYQQINNPYHSQVDITQIEPAKYTIRKSLYISYDRSVHMENGQYLTMMGVGIFKYKEMKIVTTNILEEFK
ncbi:hypothetical protein [Thorsellia anophelis]|uniref:Restriction endonuclease n=1 Tax=Thorsellia anophelis DSM 18579 TaxID=1123402 RepID=A0A1I0CF00_9GAMM|nr:hypothetical protein [Thorsellia anophelis]SET17683.1 hypothetical protein SAMN02583745_01600 [Thorsellia anophelis DSM 18579]